MSENIETPEFSFVVPLFQTGDGLNSLLTAFRELHLHESWELVLVDDGSTDGTFDRVRDLTVQFPAPVVLVELARNYGEHAAVLEGYRRSSGKWVVNLDDDLQNPVEEAVRLLEHLRCSGAEVVYSRYAKKQHTSMRNTASWLANRCASLLLRKPGDLYLSSFRALRRELVERITTYQGPFPYIDGLILGATQRISTLEVRHAARAHGGSQYNLTKLIRLSLSLLFDFSIMPLRLASVLGFILCLGGAATLAMVLVEMIALGTRQAGWGSLMGALAIFSGAQLLMLGIIGEYVGRAFLTVSGKPQSLVRTMIHRTTEAPDCA